MEPEEVARLVVMLARDHAKGSCPNSVLLSPNSSLAYARHRSRELAVGDFFAQQPLARNQFNFDSRLSL